jgi:putative alpha-1,2-mannosidase
MGINSSIKHRLFDKTYAYKGAIGLYGSVEEFMENLWSIFKNEHFNLWNEPNMIYPYLLGVDPKRMVDMQKEIQHQRSTCFTIEPDGIPGNDDAGTLSSWNVFTALGFYPVNPASGKYTIGVPLFNTIQISIPKSDSVFRVSANFNV